MKILKRIGLFAVAILMAVGAVFLPKTLKSANADTTTQTGLQFLSSDVMFSYVSYTTSSNPPKPFSALAASTILNPNWYMFSFRIRQSDEDPSLFYFSQIALNLSLSSVYPKIGSSNFDDNENTWLSYHLSTDLDSHNNYSNIKWSSNYFVDTGSGNGYTYFGYALTGGNNAFDDPSTVPTLIMKSVEIGNSYDFKEKAGLDTWFDNTSTIYNSTIVSYVDTNDYRYTFFIPNSGSSDSTYVYDYRKYYFSTPQLNNQEAYDEGYLKGQTNGYNTGYTSGYREGSVTGYDNGYDVGKQDGILQSNNYSFFGLITAVIDAPVRILTGLFNFNFLGINLWLFITSLLTISLVVVVLRKFMGKG